MRNASLPDLENFSGGTDQWYRHGLVRAVVYTAGAQYVAETAGAYWLLDMIATEGTMTALRNEPFQVWRLDVASLTITVTDGNERILHTKKLDFTDFPEPGIELWFTDNTILLPTEY
jgi:hypothetical protein